MCETLLRVTYEPCGAYPYEARRTIEIIKNNKCEYISKLIKTDVEKKTIESKEKSIAMSDIEEILNQLSTIKIPAFPKHRMGCDGAFVELEVGGYEGMSHFRWWSVPPKEWEELEVIVQKVICCSGFKLYY